MSTCMDAFVRFTCGTFLSILLISSSVYADSISVPLLSAPPVVDGVGNEWSGQKRIDVPLRNIHPESEIKADVVSVNAGIYGDSIYFYLVWEDSTQDLSHKSWKWDEKKNKYTRDTDREDRMAMQFEISGDYTTNWFSGNEFVADMWHWKSSRSNPLGIAHDKSTFISNTKLLRAYQHIDESGKEIYISRPSDSGDKLYNSKRYHAKNGERVPKYVLNRNAGGSVTDVEATGKWIDGKWHLELRRELSTGNDDDVRFIPGNSVKAGIAIFDRSENNDHAISETLVFNLAKTETAELSEK